MADFYKVTYGGQEYTVRDDPLWEKVEKLEKYHLFTKLYGVLWDKTTARMIRLYDAANITVDTTNFVYNGSVNENYNNPFDSIYPWSECKQCNVDIALYRALEQDEDIRHAVVAWYGDPDFATDGSNGFVGRYTPEFWYYGFETEEGRIFVVADREIEGFHHHLPSIRSIGFAVDDGNGGVTSNDGQPMTNVAVSTIHAKTKACGMTMHNIYEYDAESTLYAVEFANVDAQSKLGNGCTSGYTSPNFTILEAEEGATSILAPVAMKPYAIAGATLDFSTSKDGVVLANRRTVTSVEDYDSTYCKIHFTPALDVTTSMYPSIHGKDNSDSIGNKSGYLGVNGKNNAWYRGAILYGNRLQYCLGLMRQGGTGYFYICPEELCDNFDTLDTKVFKNTGIKTVAVASNKYVNVGKVTPPEDLAFFGPVTEEGTTVGDQQYCLPDSNTTTTVALLGGYANCGALCGVLYAYWNDTSGFSHWVSSGLLLLKQHHGTKIYGALWDKTGKTMTRLYAANGITTDTTNFVYSGTVNANYNNPFDSIYPWSECKQCNVDLDVFRSLKKGDDIRDAVTAWYGDADFTTDGSNGFVGRYTPEFWYCGYDTPEGRIFMVADGEAPGFRHHKASIRSIGFAVDDGNGGVTSNDGQPMTNVAVSTIHAKAKACGMTMHNIYEYDAESTLYAVEFANVDAQSKLGSGCSSGYVSPNFTVLEAEEGATSILAPVAVKSYAIAGATLDFSTSKDGVVLANRRTVTSVEDYDSTYCKIHFTPALDVTTSMYPSIHGKDNSDSIGNKSGYLGVNGKNNAWYRGAILYGNRYQYCLGLMRQGGTGYFYICPEELCDNFDTLDTKVFKNTGIKTVAVASNKYVNVGKVTPPEDLVFFGPVTEEGTTVGDQQYCIPDSNTTTTVASLGGYATRGAYGGVLFASWGNTSGNSVWGNSGLLLLKIS